MSTENITYLTFCGGVPGFSEAGHVYFLGTESFTKSGANTRFGVRMWEPHSSTLCDDCFTEMNRRVDKQLKNRPTSK